MPWPPTIPPNTRTNTDDQATVHASDHNALANALTDIVAQWTDLAYTPITASVTFTATTEATAVTVIAAPAVTFDGSTVVWVEFFSPQVYNAGASANSNIVLFQDGVSIGQFGTVFGTSQVAVPMLARRRLTPTAGSHTYSVRAWTTAGTGGVNAGTGAPGVNLPAYLRIVRA